MSDWFFCWCDADVDNDDAVDGNYDYDYDVVNGNNYGNNCYYIGR